MLHSTPLNAFTLNLLLSIVSYAMHFKVLICLPPTVQPPPLPLNINHHPFLPPPHMHARTHTHTHNPSLSLYLSLFSLSLTHTHTHTLPSRMQSMTCADVVGFHAFDHARHFLNATKRMLGIRSHTTQGGTFELACVSVSTCLSVS